MLSIPIPSRVLVRKDTGNAAAKSTLQILVWKSPGFFTINSFEPRSKNPPMFYQPMIFYDFFGSPVFFFPMFFYRRLLKTPLKLHSMGNPGWLMTGSLNDGI